MFYCSETERASNQSVIAWNPNVYEPVSNNDINVDCISVRSYTIGDKRYGRNSERLLYVSIEGSKFLLPGNLRYWKDSVKLHLANGSVNIIKMHTIIHDRWQICIVYHLIRDTSQCLTTSLVWSRTKTNYNWYRELLTRARLDIREIGGRRPVKHTPQHLR